ncbi:putative LRR receptor-like serine/threonine-protein kinase [Prunus yedoensis var. nudiflora]|uniref:Putative LRR receptor-like serine/threonine-protein kinase n=1 Tax=Prunus yedoensis var. nudiflora TaxID=2094558 RepID=A0A314XQC7_PRUYE|nr:putative LRR receptor-like serine/threonine-protein kinase [Prunus yedoensis var. nudiflora]
MCYCKYFSDYRLGHCKQYFHKQGGLDLIQVRGQSPSIFLGPKLIPLLQLDWVTCNQIGQTQRVVSLNLSGLELAGTINPHVGKLTKLQVLDLARNNLHGPIPSSISNLSSTLIRLNLGTNRLSGTIPSELGFLYKLKELDLSNNQLTGTVALSIYNISSLVLFTVASNQLWGEIPSNIGHTLPNLLYFRNCFNLLTGNIPMSLHNVSGIRSIRMSNNFLKGTVPPGLSNLPFLETYNIGFNRIVSYGDDGLNFITSLTNSTRLNYLAIDENHLQGVIPESIGNLSKVLSKLYIGGNRIYGNVPASIGQLSGLALLNVSYNSISGEIPSEIGQLKELQMLGLARNKMSAPIPNSLDLSDNALSGSIPSSFAKCTSLEELFMARNTLSGSLPNRLAEMRGLEILDLSSNQLSGSILDELKELHALSYLNLSFNHLEGVIPNGGVFVKNTSNVHLEGNPKLCLHGPCGKSGNQRRKVLVLVLIVAAALVTLAVCTVVGCLLYVRKHKGSGYEATSRETSSFDLLNGKHQCVTYEELRVATGNFNQENLIGSGGFGFVYKGYLREGIEVAVKVLDVQIKGSWKSFLAECEALRSARR